VSKIILKKLLLGDRKNLDSTAIRLDESLGDVGQPATFTVHGTDANGGVSMTDQNVKSLDKLLSFILEKLDTFGKVVLGSIGFLGLEPLDLGGDNVDLGLGGVLGVHLHRGYTLD
jgi:hypothetical protein